MNRDNLGDRMKSYESISDNQLIPKLPVIVRLDGKCFHTFTKGLERPYDENLSLLMRNTAAYLTEKYQATISYTQSDEISLLWKVPKNPLTEFFHGGRIQKIVSVLAADCTAYFNYYKDTLLPAKKGWPLQLFDCRVWCVPNEVEASNYLVWREQDATRNSIQMAGRSYFSHKELHKLNCNQIQEKLFQEKAINWNDYPWWFKRGCYYRRLLSNKGIIEVMHLKREDNLPPLTKLTNRVGFIFNQEEPQMSEIPTLAIEGVK